MANMPQFPWIDVCMCVLFIVMVVVVVFVVDIVIDGGWIVVVESIDKQT